MAQPEKTAGFVSAIPQFRVVDLPQTVAHYRGVLGFLVDEFDRQPVTFAHARRGGATIQLGSSAPAESTRAHSVGYNAYVWVDDVEALNREYLASGADIVEGPVDRAYSCRELVVRDCNGLRLCFSQDLEPDC